MVTARADGALLEFARSPLVRRIALSTAGILLAVAGVATVVFRPAPAKAPPALTPAYEVPGTRHALRIEILNGTSRDGLARVATRQMRRAGFDVVFYGGTDSAVAVSRVIARRVERDAARDVASALGIDSIVVARDTTRRVDVSVWLGSDYRPKPELHP